MKIIKDGVPERLKKVKRFECGACGCVFEAEKGEYECDTQYNETFFSCKCPCCGKNARQVKMREVTARETYRG
ncbi:MAG: hypothetical protein NC299_13380 [Lachnospiraceae bacterium]|nr:hypothetical protein [Ruminococcus sp.]MCM1276328.1 hypothetical protein [Lachnospiraceae bacterium]